jgi:hypothetical protein
MGGTNLKLKLLDSIGNVYERSRKCKLQPGFFNEIDKELELLSGYFRLSKTQAFFVAVVMAMNYKGEPADFNELIEYFRCNPMTILKYSDDFEVLCEKGYFRKDKSLHRLQLALANDQYSVNEEPFSVLSRKLIFSEEMESRLGLIRNVLIENNLVTTQKRLSSKNLPKGITILFHGEPGTGKTELVFQLAKETNRKIFKVDISQSKSLWYGESEKIIKRIFTDYAVFMKECEQVPILLFNEADAIFSARRELRASNVSQTENTVQNIILDELERFEGILMATTNLTGNFDAAFNRRFLFKVKFQKPDLNSKVKIWKLKFPKFTSDECKTLASRFDFSGAQIDNILRKSEMHEIIYGKTVNFHSIVNYCQEENQLTSSTKIGFSKS